MPKKVYIVRITDWMNDWYDTNAYGCKESADARKNKLESEDPSCTAGYDVEEFDYYD